MKFGFYFRLAADGIRKNKRMYLPYILTCIGMVMMAYIVAFLRFSPVIATLNGGATAQEIMRIGVVVTIFFAALFLFYTNSFLMKRRKKEFGLYNILGMGKGNLSRILLWESIDIALLSLALGILFGIALSKLAELGLANMLEGQITYSMSIPMDAVLLTAIPFLAIFILLFFNSLRQLWFSNPISLLRSENVGEKPPKANWFFGILGVAVLGAAYYIAVSIQDPVSALMAFLIAVLMVIAATYLIMIAGSVLLCRILQKRKGYYYKANHFVSVSSMAYRMKRNGAGLASICILATMVLVMISSTSALFIGGEDVVRNRYPREINTCVQMEENKSLTDGDIRRFESTIDGILEKRGAAQGNIIQYRSAVTAGKLNGGQVIFDVDDIDMNDFSVSSMSDVHQIYLVPVEDYNHMMGANAALAEDEVLVYAPRDTFDGDTFGFAGLKQYKVKEILKDCFPNPDMAMDIMPSLMVIVPDLAKAADGLVNAKGDALSYTKWYYSFDTSLGGEEDIALYEELKAAFGNLRKGDGDAFTSFVESREYEREGFYSLYGGLFYLSVILSIVFIFAVVLIIYYKQISEGYEDQPRFGIMQKIGMTKKDIRRSINSQLLTVFSLPLLGAGLHLAFAFPIMEKLLMLFNLHNRTLFIYTTIGSFLVFALFYAIVYRITSNGYYQIVSDSLTNDEPR